MLDRLRSLYADRTQGRGMEAEAKGEAEAEVEMGTDPGNDPSRRSEDPDDGTRAGERGTDPAEDGASVPWQDVLDGEQVSKGQVWIELGLRPHEFLAGLVRNSGGRMWQSEIVERTGWSKSTVSHYLDSPESSGTVERVRIGRVATPPVPPRTTTPRAVRRPSRPSLRRSEGVARRG